MSAGNGLAWDRLGIGVLDGKGRFLDEVQRHVSEPGVRHGTSQVVCDDFEWLEEEKVLLEGIIQILRSLGRVGPRLVEVSIKAEPGDGQGLLLGRVCE